MAGHGPNLRYGYENDDLVSNASSIFTRHHSGLFLAGPMDRPGVILSAAAEEEQFRHDEFSDPYGGRQHSRRSGTFHGREYDEPMEHSIDGDDRQPVPTSAEEPQGQRKRTKSTPLPRGQVLILVAIMMTESVCMYMLLPFVGLFVSFMQNWPAEQAGNLAGILVAMYQVGTVLSGAMWGAISDRYGRRIPLNIGLPIMAAMMLLFGFSSHFAMACIARFIQGFFNSSIIAKTVVAEITDSTNRARGFAAVSLAWGVGTISGAALGGFTYDPVGNMGADPNGFFARYPALIPSIICAGYNTFAWIVSLCLLEETNHHRRSIVDIFPAPVVAWLQRFVCVRRSQQAARERLGRLTEEAEVRRREMQERAHATARHEATLNDSGRSTDGALPRAHKKLGKRLDDGDSEEDHVWKEEGRVVSGLEDSLVSIISPQREEGGGAPAALSAAAAAPSDRTPVFSVTHTVATKLTYFDAFRMPQSRYLLLTMGLWCAADMAFFECLPLWAIVRRDRGGLAVGSQMVSVLILAMGAPDLIANVMFSWVCGLFRDKTQLYRISVAVVAVFTVVMPAGGNIPGGGGYWFSFAMGLARMFALGFAYGVIWLLVPRVAPPGHLGEMNGIVNSFSSLVRCTVPFAAAPLFAFSVSSTSHHFPYDHFLIFLISGILTMGSFVASIFLKLPLDAPPRRWRGGTRNEGRRSADDELQRGEVAEFEATSPATDCEEDISAV